MAQINQVLPRGNFMSFSFSTFNIYYAVILATSGAAAASVGGVKAYRSYQERAEQKHVEATALAPKPVRGTTLTLADTISAVPANSTPEVTNGPKQPVASEQPKAMYPTSSCGQRSIIGSPKTETAPPDQAPAALLAPQVTAPVDATPVAEEKVVEALALPANNVVDSTTRQAKPRRVVYVKPQQVVIEDTVIQVVKKKKKR
jgi:hypothetical protein